MIARMIIDTLCIHIHVWMFDSYQDSVLRKAEYEKKDVEWRKN